VRQQTLPPTKATPTTTELHSRVTISIKIKFKNFSRDGVSAEHIKRLVTADAVDKPSNCHVEYKDLSIAQVQERQYPFIELDRPVTTFVLVIHVLLQISLPDIYFSNNKPVIERENRPYC
jgi:hypothetical protein